LKYTEWPKNIPTSSIARPYKIYPNWDFWFKNIPSGNPDANARKKLLSIKTTFAVVKGNGTFDFRRTMQIGLGFNMAKKVRGQF
jgi:hypothetical protein